MNAQAQDFVPRWASPPGDTIKDVLTERGMSPEAFAKSIDLPTSGLPELLRGAMPISIDLARRISAAIGGSIEFWVARDGQYRDDRARIEADAWADTLPIADMVTYGWIDRPSDWQERIAAALEFFGIENVSEWDHRYQQVIAEARFRSSRAASSDASISAWLRRAEQAGSAKVGAWDPEAFSDALGLIRPLSRISDPSRFIPELVALSGACGVVVTVVRAPRGCGVSGAARFLERDRPQIVLSARYLADDHFWFTFFHEAAHLLLHDSDAIFIDEIDLRSGRPTSKAEREADDFAMNVLVPADVRQRLAAERISPARLHQLARDGGIATGVLVGQLQHAGTLSFRSVYNRLKRRYRWVGSSLERA